MSEPAYDYVIVGAGSSGCVLAERLSADPDIRVLLVESGPADDHAFIAMPMGFGRLMTPDSPHYWRYTASKGGNRGSEAWVKGRTLGGSSSINGMVYVRGMPADYDAWEAGGATGWNWATIERCFQAIENHQLGEGGSRGTDGPLKVSVPTGRDRLSAAVLAATRQAGADVVADINDPSTQDAGGFGPQPCTIDGGRRWSAASAFLRPARKRRNLTVLTDTDVTALSFDGRRTTGVEVRHAGQARTIGVRREVILSAGAINSPKILQLAGIGPGRHLSGLGVPVLVDLPGVGANLCEHRTVSTVFRLRRGGSNSGLRGPGVYFSALRYYLARSGPLARSMFDVGGFVRTFEGLERPDAQIGIGFHSFDAAGITSFPGMTMYGYQMRPQSRGRTEICSTDPAAPPFIDANYLATPDDRRHVVALLRHMRRIAAQPALAGLIEEEVRPGPEAQTDDDLIEASFTFGGPGYHVAGTCRMGTDEMAVVSPELKVRGVEGLRVVDTSVMPQLSGNTNAPAMAIAWRAAEIMRAKA
jgi:choline dehydrogenase-like flavoprotein